MELFDNRPMTVQDEINMLNDKIAKLEQELKYARDQWNDYCKYKVAFTTLVETLKRGN